MMKVEQRKLLVPFEAPTAQNMLELLIQSEVISAQLVIVFSQSQSVVLALDFGFDFDFDVDCDVEVDAV